MADKKLLHAKQIPLIGIDGKRKSRMKEFWESKGGIVRRERPSPPEMPLCKCGRTRMGRVQKVLPDAFGRPTDKCEICRQEAAGVDVAGVKAR